MFFLPTFCQPNPSNRVVLESTIREIGQPFQLPNRTKWDAVGQGKTTSIELENRYGGNFIVGSNPTLSATLVTELAQTSTEWSGPFVVMSTDWPRIFLEPCFSGVKLSPTREPYPGGVLQGYVQLERQGPRVSNRLLKELPEMRVSPDISRLLPLPR